VIRASILAVLLAMLIAVPALAQSATPTTGDVGSAALRNGYPSGFAQPLATPSGEPTANRQTGTATNNFNTPGSTSGGAAASTGGTAPASGGGARGGGTGRGSTTGSSRSAATRSGGTGGGNWVVCPPSGASGLAPLFAGTDLSCAPD
jgi:hypothetical protein